MEFRRTYAIHVFVTRVIRDHINLGLVSGLRVDNIIMTFTIECLNLGSVLSARLDGIIVKSTTNRLQADVL